MATESEKPAASVPPDAEGKKQVGIKLTAEARRLRVALAQKLGVDQTAVVELALREKAARDGVQ